MDLRRLQQRPSMSVNTFAAPNLFQQHLRAALVNETSLHPQYHHHNHYPRQAWILPSQHYPQQRPRPFQPYASQQQFVTMNPALNNHNQPFAPGYTPEDAKAMFSGEIDDMFGSGSASGIPATYPPSAYERFSFRPLAPLQTAAFETYKNPFKFENEPAAGIMPLQTTHVDTRQYSPVSNEEVWNSPYDHSSPSTIDTDGDSPVTPALEQHDAFFNHYAARQGLTNPSYFSGTSPAAHGLMSTQSSFDTYHSGDAASYQGSSFSSQGSLARDVTSSGQLCGLATDCPRAQDGRSASGLANPQFGHDTSSFSESLSESESGDDGDSETSSASSREAGVRNDRDQVLLDLRKQGLSYKEIKRRGNFKEAESTLRGRMRVLTKEKHERVRRPVWNDRDVQLLRRAVKKCHVKSAEGSRKALKMPWLKISDWILANGASYNFAAATCARKWKDVCKK